MSDTHIWIDYEEIRSTDKAVLLDTDAGEVWVPKSVIGARGKDRMEVARWWAEKNGLADEKDGL